MKLEKLLCLKYLGNIEIENWAMSSIAKLSPASLHDIILSLSLSSTISQHFLRKGGTDPDGPDPSPPPFSADFTMFKKAKILKLNSIWDFGFRKFPGGFQWNWMESDAKCRVLTTKFRSLFLRVCRVDGGLWSLLSGTFERQTGFVSGFGVCG